MGRGKGKQAWLPGGDNMVNVWEAAVALSTSARTQKNAARGRNIEARGERSGPTNNPKKDSMSSQ